MDTLISALDSALRTVFAPHHAHRENPGLTHEDHALSVPLSDTEKREAAALMRVNHVGEVCAQALYQSQKLVARNGDIKEMLNHSGQEEIDHLAWCETRLKELGSHTSYLNPWWYAGSFAIGLAAG